MIKIRVKLSDAPEFEATVLRDNGDSLYIEGTDGFRTVIRPWQVVSPEIEMLDLDGNER